ncbi:MAG: hypothetical protein KGN02_08565 [bacterium]|nr:hypothetical protein [bacterium]
MEHRFTARLRGLDPASAAYVEVPRFVMRALPWGRYVRVVARINDKVDLPATIMNVGYGPSFLVPRHALESCGAALNAPVSVTIRA